MATEYNIGFDDNPPIEQGSTFELLFTVTNVFGATQVSDLTLRGEYRPNIDGSPFTPFVGTIISVTPALVTGKLTMDAATTASLTASKTGSWDCEIQAGSGYVLKPLGCGNKCMVKREATRSV